MQRKIIPKEIKSKLGRLISGLLIAYLIASSFWYSTPNTGNGVGEGAFVTFGTSFSSNSYNAPVSGTNFSVGNNVYARLYSPTQFGTSTLKVIIEKKDSAAWAPYHSKNMATSPKSRIFIAHFQVSDPGTYRIEFFNGNNEIADNTVQIQ